MIKKFGIGFAVFIVVLYVLFTFTAIPEPFPKESFSAKWMAEGPYKTKTFDVVLQDQTRITQENTRFGDFQGLPYRELNTTVWYPDQLTSRAHPLIVYSHGLSSERSDGAYLSTLLASHGYIVMGTDYPLTSRHAPGAALISDVSNQPGDISFLLDSISNSGNPLGDRFSEYIDNNKIAALGISLGGLTTSLVAYHPQWRDSRIKAAVSIAGVSAMLGRKFYQDSNLPFMMVGATVDAVLPFEYHAKVIPQRVNNSILVSIQNGSHMGFADVARSVRWMNNTDVIACTFINWLRNMANVESDKEKEWYSVLGTKEQGFILDEESEACPPDFEYPKAINPIKQQMLTKVVVLSFFEQHFSRSAQRRSEAKDFIRNQFSDENTLITVSFSNN